MKYYAKKYINIKDKVLIIVGSAEVFICLFYKIALLSFKNIGFNLLLIIEMNSVHNQIYYSK